MIRREDIDWLTDAEIREHYFTSLQKLALISPVHRFNLEHIESFEFTAANACAFLLKEGYSFSSGLFETLDFPCVVWCKTRAYTKRIGDVDRIVLEVMLVDSCAREDL